ncbi:HAMP domain-containing protein [Rhodobacteraceae bacterium RKSG542]|uniref:sensor histidine kinase n=1 Tax=Pseudovibrio flavus TaxID=2529854 RepID=UPI0012BCB525|nr:sensor histidine kinase [Pseudovibrio flavus]MTI17811.1 HAMP domain-containing protein [Pseudovibrio flavus]
MLESDNSQESAKEPAGKTQAHEGHGKSRFRWLRRKQVRRRVFSRWGGLLGTYIFSSLTRRILVLNLVGLVAMVVGILYLNQFRAGLIDARVQSLLTQGEIIAGAIAASATADTNTVMVDPEQLLRLEAGESLSPRGSLSNLDFPINPEQVGPVLRRLISPTKTRARIYDPDGTLLLDSRKIYDYDQIFRFDLPHPEETKTPFLEGLWQQAKLWMRRGELPLYHEYDGHDGLKYAEVEAAMSGSPASVVRLSDKGEMIVSVAVPIQRFRAVLGTLLLSTQGGDIDAIVAAERNAIIKIFIVAAVVVIILSILLAGTIAGPVRRLSEAAQRVQRSIKSREEIPDFGDRHDEIGFLARALRDMTNTLYDRMEAIESFAADVAHELKNPLTSLRSAVETLPLAKTEDSRARLMEIIQHDVRRLDRLISDISEASRVDAEMARAENQSFDLAVLLRTLAEIANERTREGEPEVVIEVVPSKIEHPFEMVGNGERLSQVFNNLIDNARSFSPEGGKVYLTARREQSKIVVTVEDEGPGIGADVMERIFERFYTDRPETEGFGNNSGLGLSICRQIVQAHNGTITAENRSDNAKSEDDKAKTGARFIVTLPVRH